MIIREAKIDDYKAINHLNQQGFGMALEEQVAKEKLSFLLNISTNKLFVAEVDDRVAGYIHLSAYECTFYESMKSVQSLVVDKDFRRMGIAKSLLEASEKWAKSQNPKGIWLVSGHDRVGAHAFYMSCGYTMRKEQKNFIKWF